MMNLPANWIPIERWIYVRAVAGVKDIWGLEVVGDALESANIIHDDIAIYTNQKEIIDGRLYAVQTPAGLTLRYAYEVSGRVLLRHPALESEHYQPSQVTIIGRVVRVDRDGQPIEAQLRFDDINKVLPFVKGGVE